MAHTTVDDYEDYAGEVYGAAEQARITYFIPVAERKLARRVGQDFHGDSTNATADWIFVTCVVTDWLLTMDDADTRDALAGPYQSERLGDYAYSLKDVTQDKRWTIWMDMRIKDILSEYHVPQDPARVFATVAGRAYPRAETTEVGGYYLP